MEEKNMQELSMEDMDKVSGGAHELETIDRIIKQSGLAPAVYSLPRKEAVAKIINYLEQNGLGYLDVWATNLYNMYY